jgi:hypothetical protein
MLFKSHTRKGIGRPGRYGPKNAARMSLLRGETRGCLQANHQRITTRAYVTKKWLVFKQTSKGITKVLARERSRQGKDVAGLP